MSEENMNLNYCNFAKTVLMLLVVLCHSAAFYSGNWFTACAPVQVNISFSHLSSWLGTFHVAGFTLISGYIYYSLKNEKGKYNKLSEVLRNKVRRLLIPYIAISALWVIPIGYVFFDYDLRDVISKYILGESPSQLWFLLMLFNVFIIANFLFNKVEGLKLALSVISLFVLGTVLSSLLPNLYQLFTSMRYLLFFYIGYSLRMRYPNLKPNTMLFVGIIFLLVNVICFAVVTDYNFNSSLFDKLIRLVLNNASNLSGAVMAFLLLSYIASRITTENSLFRVLSSLSFPIYLFHQQVIYILLWNLSDKYDPGLMVTFNFLFSLIISAFIGYILSLNKYTTYII